MFIVLFKYLQFKILKVNNGPREIMASMLVAFPRDAVTVIDEGASSFAPFS